MGEAGGTNLNAFAVNSPANLVDPLGLTIRCKCSLAKLLEEYHIKFYHRVC